MSDVGVVAAVLVEAADFVVVPDGDDAVLLGLASVVDAVVVVFLAGVDFDAVLFDGVDFDGVDFDGVDFVVLVFAGVDVLADFFAADFFVAVFLVAVAFAGVDLVVDAFFAGLALAAVFAAVFLAAAEVLVGVDFDAVFAVADLVAGSFAEADFDAAVVLTVPVAFVVADFAVAFFADGADFAAAVLFAEDAVDGVDFDGVDFVVPFFAGATFAVAEVVAALWTAAREGVALFVASAVAEREGTGSGATVGFSVFEPRPGTTRAALRAPVVARPARVAVPPARPERNERTSLLRRSISCWALPSSERVDKPTFSSWPLISAWTVWRISSRFAAAAAISSSASAET